MLKQQRKLLGAGVMLLGLLAVLACAGGSTGTAAPAPQQPAAAAQPAPAAPAAEPQAAPAAERPRPPVPFTPPQPAKAPLANPKYGGIVTFALRQDPPGGWDVMRVTQRYDLHAAGAPLWGSANLVRECPEDVYKVCGGLAESWEVNKDFSQYTFKIREKVFWHDGKPFTAEDAKFYLDLLHFGAKSGDKTRLPAWFRAEVGEGQKVELLDGNRIRLTLANPTPTALEAMVFPAYTVALPRHLVLPRIERGEVNVTPQDIGWIGTGPFKMLKYDKGTRIQVRRNDLYWEKDKEGRQLPFLDGIDTAIIRDPSAMHAAIRVGRLDGGARQGGYYVTKDQKPGYERDLGDQVWFTQTASGGGTGLGMGLNLLKPGPLQDIRVRRAISLWVDKEASIAAFQGGFGYVAGILAPTNPFTNPDFATWPGINPATRAADRAEAKRLMAQAGYPNGGFTLTYNCNRTYLDRCQFYQGQVAGLGIDFKFEIMDAAQWIPAGLSLDYDMFQTGGPVSPIPEVHESSLTRYSVSKSTLVKHEDPKVPELFTRMKTATSLDQRVKTWRELERYLILDQVYVIPLSGYFGYAPYRSYVKGMFVPPEGLLSYIDFATVWLDK